MPEFKLTGIAELDQTFAKYKRAVQNRIARKACRVGGKEVLKRAKQLVPDRRRRGADKKLVKGLRKSLTQRVKTYRQANLTMSIVGPGWPHGAHGHLVEYGHDMVDHDGRPTVFGRRRTRPFPFLRPARDAARGSVRTAMASSFRTQLRAPIK